MAKSVNMMVVNLKTFIRDKKGLLFLFLVPVIFYTMMGFIFGSIGSYAESINYNIGFINYDNQSIANENRPNYNLSLIYEIIDDIDGFTLYNYSTVDEANHAAKDDIIVAYLTFPEGFEAELNRSAYTHIGWYNNDSSFFPPYDISWLYNTLLIQTQLFFEFTNISDSNFNNILNDFNETKYDSLLVIEDGFIANIGSGSKAEMTYYFRNGTAEEKIEANKAIIKNIAETLYGISGDNIEIKENLINAQAFGIPSVEIYFLQSVSLSDRQVIEGLIQQVILGVINYNPTDVNIDFEIKSAQGRKVNALTFNTPGYLIYGPMTILSFILAMITGLRKDGIFKRLSTTEFTNKEIILGFLGTSLILTFIQSFIGIGISFLFGFDPIVYDLLNGLIGVMLNILFFSLVILSLGLMLVPVFKNPEAAGGGVWVVIFPLMMFSGGFFPVEYLGEELAQIVYFLPTRLTVVAYQDLLLNGLPIWTPSILINFGIQTIYIVVFFLIGIKTFDKFKL